MTLYQSLHAVSSCNCVCGNLGHYHQLEHGLHNHGNQMLVCCLIILHPFVNR